MTLHDLIRYWLKRFNYEAGDRRSIPYYLLLVWLVVGLGGSHDRARVSGRA
jgi:hypothetical protein